ncbi:MULTISPECIES: hypothetical protein [Burkholderia]|uniref:hypothetical protein n=1 Tax=Burkholderia TaxID=32008 RepID=UPI00117CC6BE|nr:MULTISPECIES: hypothetical protein [Burkholderia]
MSVSLSGERIEAIQGEVEWLAAIRRLAMQSRRSGELQEKQASRARKPNPSRQSSMRKIPTTVESSRSRLSGWLALAPICALLAGCPPMIVPNVQTHAYNQVYHFSDDPQPWLTLENEGISLYLYQGCDDPPNACRRQNLVALKRGTPPEWKNLLDARSVSWRIQGMNVPMRRPLSAYVPGTQYRLMGSFDTYPEIVFSIPKNLTDHRNYDAAANTTRYVKIEEFNTLAYPQDLNVKLVIYDDTHQWIFIDQPKFKPDRTDNPTDLFIPSKLFRFEASDDARLNQPMALYYVSPATAPTGYRVVSGKAAESWIDKYKIKYPAHQIGLADVTFPSAPLTLDTRTVESRTVSGQPTLQCRYSSTQFNLGWMDTAQRGGPSEAERKGCEPYQGQAATKG